MLFSLALLLTTGAGIALFIVKPVWFPLSVTTAAFAYDRQFTRTLWITGIVFIAVQLLLAWIIVRQRRPVKSASSFGYPKLELTWMIATGAVFITLSVLGSRGWAKTSTPAGDKEIVEVDAHQFAWSFRYPGPDGLFGRTSLEFISDSGGNPAGIDPKDSAGTDDITTNTLRIPAHRDVRLLLHSRDVIHDFFVRELRTKQDMVPGMEIPLEIHVDRPGTYEIACAELCGLGHSQMRSVMLVMTPEDYDRWKHQH